MAKPFKWSLQPALDKAIHDRQLAESAVLEARRELEAAEARLRELRESLEEVVQRIAVEHDHLVRQTDARRDPIQQDELIRALRAREAVRREAVDRQTVEVGFSRQRLEHRQAELQEAAGREQGLERTREKALKEHAKAAQQRLQAEIDDAGIQGSIRRDRGH